MLIPLKAHQEVTILVNPLARDQQQAFAAHHRTWFRPFGRFAHAALEINQGLAHDLQQCLLYHFAKKHLNLDSHPLTSLEIFFAPLVTDRFPLQQRRVLLFHQFAHH